MRSLLAAILLLAAAAARADDEPEKLVVQGHLFAPPLELHLGDSLKSVRGTFPPKKDWPATKDKRHGVTRYRLDAGLVKAFPAHVQTLYLGFHSFGGFGDGSLVEMEVVYDEEYTRRESSEHLAGDYSLLYGPPKHSGDRFWWSDGKTVLRVFPAEIPTGRGAAASDAEPRSTAWRTAVQLFKQSVFEE